MDAQRNVLILYYSAFCQHCRKFMEEIKRSKYNGQFRMISTDPDMQTKRRPPLPQFVKSVPTVYIKTPQGQKILKGKDAFLWLQGTPQGNTKSGGIKDSTGLDVYLPQENGISCGYSMLDGTNIDSQSYTLLQQTGQTIYTPTDKSDPTFARQTPTPAQLPQLSPQQMGGMHQGSKADVTNAFDSLLQQRAEEMKALQKAPRPI